jgi:2-phospho-L-lactate guanylyltransferase
LSKKTAIVIPIKRFEKSKTRLSPYLGFNQRKILTKLLLLDTLDKVSKLKNTQPILVSSEKLKLPSRFDDAIILNEKNGNSGVNNAIELANRFIESNHFEESIIIPIDLPIMSVGDLEKVIDYSKEFNDGICIVPSKRYDGTNILLRKPNLVINTFYDDNSFYNHIKSATEKKKIVKIFNFESLMIDLDTFEDISYILDNCNKIDYDDLLEKNGINISRSIAFLNKIIKNVSINRKEKGLS